MTGPDKTAAVRGRVFRSILYGDFAPGDRLPTERAMAELCGISRVTVRRAYDELARSGVLERRRGSGTFVAQPAGANAGAGNLTALLSSVGDPFALDFIRALERELAAADELLVLRLTDESPELEEEAAIELVGQGIRNLVIWPSGGSFPGATFARLRVLGVNLVFFDRMLPGDYADYVGLDNADAMRRLFRVAGDIRRPLFVGHADLVADSDRLREEAFAAECARRKLEPRILKLPRHGVWERPPELRDADAVFAVNDAMGLRLLPYAGTVPVYGIDGLSYRLTSCRQPMPELARAVVRSLQEQRRAGSAWRAGRKWIQGVIHEKVH